MDRPRQGWGLGGSGATAHCADYWVEVGAFMGICKGNL